MERPCPTLTGQAITPTTSSIFNAQSSMMMMEIGWTGIVILTMTMSAKLCQLPVTNASLFNPRNKCLMVSNLLACSFGQHYDKVTENCIASPASSGKSISKYTFKWPKNVNKPIWDCLQIVSSRFYGYSHPQWGFSWNYQRCYLHDVWWHKRMLQNWRH